MRAFVFTDKALAKHAGQFVWLSIDTEKTQNASFLRKYPIRAWPSMYVIDPEKETIALRWVGGATVGQLEKLFEQGRRAVHADEKGSAESLARADALYGAGKYAESVPAYRDVLKTLPADSPDYPRVAEALLFGLIATKQDAECVDVARAAYPKLRHTPSGVTMAGGGLDCALSLPEGAPGRVSAVAEFEADARTVLADQSLPLSADDRHALYASIHDAREDAKDAEGAQKVARAWVDYLDAQAAAAKTPEQRTALDPDRYGAYQAAGEIEKALPMLVQSEKDFPNDYNPPARLASAYFKLKRYDEALAASDRALAKVYGPRKIRVLIVRADIYKASGDAAKEKATLDEAYAYADNLPEGQRSAQDVASLKKRLDSTAPASQ